MGMNHEGLLCLRLQNSPSGWKLPLCCPTERIGEHKPGKKKNKDVLGVQPESTLRALPGPPALKTSPTDL